LNDSDELSRLRWTWRVYELDEMGVSYEIYAGEFKQWVIAHDQSHIPFVAHDGRCARGMIWLAVHERVFHPDLGLRPIGQVQSAYVMPEFRNTGIGKLLVKRLVEFAIEREMEYLFVRPNLSSVEFYRRLGFLGDDAMLLLELST
jgi:ribosomal protein S18 acetylase RimI-like enzyme